MPSNASLLVLVFAKAPAAGQVKTRLAESVGHREAAGWARAFLQDTWSRVAELGGASVRLVLDGDAPLPPLLPAPEIWEQGKGDLGARLERSFHRALAEGTAAMAVGTDSPGMPKLRLIEAQRALADGSDAVLGLADDGGFYLIGLRRCPPGLFAGLPWSVASTGAAMLSRLEQQGLTVRRLPNWYDVDDQPSLLRLEREVLSGATHAPECKARFVEAGRVMPEGARPTISVIVPVLDEAKQLPSQLDALTGQMGLEEVIVVDGGSRDGTIEIARRAGVRVLSSARGRARQMNAGARVARGDVLLFLHADVRLPAHASGHVRRTLREAQVVAGAFRTWTLAEHGSAPWLHLADLRSRYSKTPYGDQALFVRRTAFESVGGFPDQPLMEDYELSRRLRRHGRIRIARPSVLVSGRRFVRGPLRYALLVNLYPLLYRLGVSPERLRRFYHDVR